jgi:hypothetical protein
MLPVGKLLTFSPTGYIYKATDTDIVNKERLGENVKSKLFTI